MNILLSGPWRLSPARRRALVKAARAALGPAAERPGELCLVLVDDREIRRLNKRHLGHAYATDVIAFPYPLPPGARRTPETPFGDIYVARGVAKRQAAELGHGLFRELLTLAVHGALHLAGYDDHKPADKKRMFARQERIARRFAGE